jgi:prepilin-type N-terminal cleavage/methylation domain-containing protein
MKILFRSAARVTRGATPQHRERRKGFVIVEVIVAMVLLGVAVSALAALVFSVSQSGIRTTGDAYKNGVLMHEVNRLEGLPYALIPVGTSSYTITGGSYPHTRVITTTEPKTDVKYVQVIISPVNPRYKPDTVSFTRTRARTSKVLCTVGCL